MSKPKIKILRWEDSELILNELGYDRNIPISAINIKRIPLYTKKDIVCWTHLGWYGSMFWYNHYHYCTYKSSINDKIIEAYKNFYYDEGEFFESKFKLLFQQIINNQIRL